MTPSPEAQSEARRLRSAFDLSFASPPRQAAPDVEDLLAIRVAGDPWAIRVREIVGMVAGSRVVPLPSVTLDLLGLAGIRGEVVPVFGLASILGYGQAPAPPRWMILCGEHEPIALAFADFEGHLRLPSSRLSIDVQQRTTNPYVNQVASTDTGVRTVINIPLIVATIRNRSGLDRLARGQ